MAPFSIINSSTGLDDYLDRVRRRLRASLASRGLGALALTALLVTVCGVYVANKLAFSTAGMAGARALLIAAVAAVAAVLLVRPLRGLSARRAADEAERRSPAFGGRLDAWVDQTARARGADAPANPLLDLLREDTLRVARTVPLDDVVGRGRILAFYRRRDRRPGGAAWLGTSGPGYWQYGTSRLWTGWFLSADAPLYEFWSSRATQPCAKAPTWPFPPVRSASTRPAWTFTPNSRAASIGRRPQWGRNSKAADMSLPFRRCASRYVTTWSPAECARASSTSMWSPCPTSKASDSNTSSLRGPASTRSSKTPAGDIRAVKGTKVKVDGHDRQAAAGRHPCGRRRADCAARRPSRDRGGRRRRISCRRGLYIRLTDDFFITVVPDEKPVLEILEPARDWKATGIEEVMARFKAGDDFGLRSLELRYSVNGVEQPKIAFGGVRGKKEFRAGRLFQLEELGEALVEAPAPPALAPGASAEPLPPPAPPAGLIPGDLISYYATASDGRNETRTDIYFIEIQPFNRSFSQSQQSGGGGQGGGQQDEISRREKEIIVATWNLIKERDAGDGRKSDELRESAAMLAELQATLMSQATTLAERARARQLTASDPKFKQFVEYMEKAAEFMKPAADALAAYELDDAVGPEQQALQYLLRAESIFTDIQISMNRNGGGGGGGGASRDLAEMFELEMDLKKNQYETGGGSSGQQIEQEIDDAFKKLEELARRQEQLADRARGRQEMGFEERWKQEMLRREAEELKRQLEQLQRRQQSQGRNGQQSRSSSSSSGSSSGASGGDAQGRPQQQQLERTIRELDRATRAMEQGNRNGSPSGQSASQAQQQLREALQAMSEERQQQSRDAIAQMRQSAERLAREQEQTAERLQQSLETALAAIKAQGGQQRGLPPTGMTREEEIALAERKAAMGERLAEIERGMQVQSRRLREENRAASSRLRAALGDLQQSEAATALLNASDMIRRGMAPYIAQGERGVSRALSQLRDDLKDIEQLAQSGGEDRQLGLARALHDMENLRRRMEEAAGLGESGRRPQGQDGEGRQAGGRQPGRQPGGERQADRPGGGGAPSGEPSSQSRQAAPGPRRRRQRAPRRPRRVGRGQLRRLGSSALPRRGRSANPQQDGGRVAARDCRCPANRQPAAAVRPIRAARPRRVSRFRPRPLQRAIPGQPRTA